MLTIRTVPDHAQFVVQIVFTTSSKTDWLRIQRPAPCDAHESAGSSASFA